MEKKTKRGLLVLGGLATGVGLAILISKQAEAEVPPGGGGGGGGGGEQPTLIFGFGSPSAQVKGCTLATAWATVNFQCNMTNHNAVAVTREISFKARGFSHTYQIPTGPYTYDTLTVTLQPGASYTFSWDGDYPPGYPDITCNPSIPKHYDYYFYLEDELGNKSSEAEVSVA